MLQWLSLLLEIILQFSKCGFQFPCQQPLLDAPGESSAVYFCKQWQSLGPWRIGTREAAWGADPLEAYGGFRTLNYHPDDVYYSPLTPNATVKWKHFDFETNHSASTTLVYIGVDYHDVDWESIQKIYGWAALQYQVWLRGTIVNPTDSRRMLLLYTTHIIEVWIDGHLFFGGDLYGFEKVPIVLDLNPGLTTIEIRLIRDVRSMGGSLPPTIEASLRAETVSEKVHLLQSSLVLPDIVSGRLSSRYGSVVIRNQLQHEITIKDVLTQNRETILTLIDAPISIAPGQSRPISFVFTMTATTPVKIHIKFLYDGSEEDLGLPCVFEFKTRDAFSPHKMTFLHPSGTVSYAILRPPPMTSPYHNQSLPILINLHGAGLHADSDQVRHTLDAATDLAAWVLFPTGMSPWSGDDWHVWGFTDIQAAAAAIPEWIDTTQWNGSDVRQDKYFVSGHSNGGQGTWYFLTHQPDKIIAAAPVSGYSSIENYVPYSMWNEAEAALSYQLDLARMSYRHELLMENIRNLPVYIQHGQQDDNVPAYHSRLMTSLHVWLGNLITYLELPAKGHWFEGVMTTKPLLDFYHNHLCSDTTEVIVPNRFSFVCPNTNEMGSKFGIEVDQLLNPRFLAKFDVIRTKVNGSHVWHIRSENVLRLHFQFEPGLNHYPDILRLDDTSTTFLRNKITPNTTFVRLENRSWVADARQDWKSLNARYGKQRGAMDSILRTQGPFQILYCSRDVISIALQISRNLLQYFGADSNLLHCSEYNDALKSRGNLITIATGTTLPPPQLETFPITVDNHSVNVMVPGGTASSYSYSLQPLGGLWLRPLPSERLELVIWGSEISSLEQASRLAPTLTGIGQPDFILLNTDAKWKGHAGAVTMGFFDSNWQI